MSGPLKDIKVIDLTSVVMGPYATQILGDMGGDVIKVEPLDGDVTRHLFPFRNPGMGASFLNLNRNKRSIALDLKCEAAREVMRRLVTTSDVLVFNVRPQAMRKLGLDYRTLSELNPRLIYCGAYGFSEQGPYAGKPAFDDTIQAMSGIAHHQGIGNTYDDGPVYVKAILADKVAALTIAYTVAMALYAREKTGRGQEIEVPMFETLVSFSLVEHLAGLTFVPPVGRSGYTRALAPYRRPYQTSDGYLSVLPYTTAQWLRFFELAERPDLGADTRFSDPAERSKNIGELYGILAEVMLTKTTNEWYSLLQIADIPSARVMSPEDLLRDDHMCDIDFFKNYVHPTEEEIVMMDIPTYFSDTPGSIRRHAPRCGEHTDEILAALEYTSEQRRLMHQAKVCASASPSQFCGN